jgi:oxygen-independent coproporphyrinogen III oxidase
MKMDDYVSTIKAEATSALGEIPLRSLREHGLLRDRNAYFLNISYPSMQAMNEIDPRRIEEKYKANGEKRSVALYIHIPFCSGLCYYCHYYKVIGRHQMVDPYLAAISAELLNYKRMSPDLEARSIYVGGGTPSFLNSHQIRMLFASIRKAIEISPTAEISFEVHPENANPELLMCLREMGVNRLNFGVESFDDAILQTEHRRHTSKMAADAITLAKDCGFDNINIDLIYGLRHQSVEGWIKSIATATALEPASVCAYYLRIKETTPIYKAFIKDGQKEFPTEDENLLMHLATLKHMSHVNYSQLIVDWFFRDQKYFHTYQMDNWQRTDATPLLGIGASAYSYIDGVQYYNINDLEEYCLRISSGKSPVNKGEILESGAEKARRALMLGLKCKVDLKYFINQYDIDIVEYFSDQFSILQKFGLINIYSNTVELSPAGTLFADEIGQMFYSAPMQARMDLISKSKVSTTLPHINQFKSIRESAVH